VVARAHGVVPATGANPSACSSKWTSRRKRCSGLRSGDPLRKTVPNPRSTTWTSRVVTVFENKGGREVLTLVVLVILAALWAVVLVPPLLRSRTERTNDSIGDFNFRLDALGRTNGALHRGAMRAEPGQFAAKRRRDVTRVLLIAVGVSGMLALATNLAALVDVALVTFAALWAWARSVQAERALKVRAIPPRRAELAPRRAERPLRHVASS